MNGIFSFFRQSSIEQTQIPISDIENALSRFCAPPPPDKKTGSVGSISDSTFKHITELLTHLESHHDHQGWKTRPRTYTVLRNIDRLDLFPHFIDRDLNDIAFPYTIDKLPDFIDEDGVRDKFLRHQKYILTDANHLEKGRHAYTKNGEDLFHLVKHLGRGGYGSVDMVWSRMSFRCFARKQFLRKRSAKEDQTVLKMFENELANIKRLSHEHLVKVVGSYTDQRSFAFLMDLVADMNLLTLLEQYNRLQNDWSPSLRSYFGCLANAVAHLHTQRIRHRDLKPANILIKDFKVYIADFGSALDWSNTTKDTTAEASVPATARYMSPEVANRTPRNSASDMWSLGVVYLEMVTVLRGRSLASLMKFMENNGTKHPYVYGNAPATTRWFEELRLSSSGPTSDNEPLTWIKDLTQRDPRRRPLPWALTDQIRHSACSTAFMGICCANDDEIVESPPPTSPFTYPREDADEVPLLEQLEAFGSIEKPFGALVRPSQQSSVERWLGMNPISAVAEVAPAVTLPDITMREEPYGIEYDEPTVPTTENSLYLDTVRQDLQQERVIETCDGYDITEDLSDDEGGEGQIGYEVTEDSSDSEPTVCPPSPSIPADSLGSPISETREVFEQLDSLAESPEGAGAVLQIAEIPTSTTARSRDSSTASCVRERPNPKAELPVPVPVPETQESVQIPPARSRNRACNTISNIPTVTDLQPRVLLRKIAEPDSAATRLRDNSTASCVRERPNPSTELPVPVPVPKTQGSVQTPPARSRNRACNAISNVPRVADLQPRVLPCKIAEPDSAAARLRDSSTASCVRERPNPNTELPVPVPVPETQGSVETPLARSRNRAPNSTHARGNALTAQNLSQLDSNASNKDRQASQVKRLPSSLAKPKMTAEFYMQEVWEAASTIETSVLSVGTQKAISRLGPGVVWQDRHMHYVTHYAKMGKAAAVRELLLAGCNPGTKKKPNHKPLISAVRAGTQRHNKVVRALLDHGADVNARDPGSGKTALHFAIENAYFPGYTNLIRNLLEHAADPNVLDWSKDTPLLQILYGGYKPLEKHKRDALACLLQPHLDVDVNVKPLGTSDMPIHLAVRRHDAIAVAMLIHKGSRVNDPNGAGATPLRIAARSWKENPPDNDIELLKYLLEGGAKVNEASGDNQDTALHLAAAQGCLQIVNILLSRKANPELCDKEGKTVAEVATANKPKMSDETYAAIQKGIQKALKLDNRKRQGAKD
ncbi:MAG: hypothetical protein Q9181_003768 [Wetmoreana brouardii]